ncbi:helix-turn-helix transcriptional regulator [Ornithinimicrobium murale]|uniref:helix-turn-helix transcriptional regulator n=1 Tax=Ornithinimicrobium murale TaxID=1050153 RepID=UPI001EDCEA80|nr:AraC family transcriptional regulator [Ornithinimicrobium murale]
MRLIFVRHGSAILLSEFGEKPVAVGDIVALAANTVCGSEPEGSITVTTLYLDRDYVIDQVFWQHAALLTDRWDAQDFADELYSEPAQILHLGEDRAGMLMPWLDELVSLSLDGPSPEKFYRMQALLFAVLDVITPYVKTTPARRSPTQRKANGPGLPRYRYLAPLRAEAHQAAALLRADIARRWTLESLASEVHLSRSRLSAVFVEAYGKTPLAYLNMLRAEAMARLLRDSDATIEAASKQVGWDSRSHAASVFRRSVGVTPSRYRSRVLNGV